MGAVRLVGAVGGAMGSLGPEAAASQDGRRVRQSGERAIDATLKERVCAAARRRGRRLGRGRGGRIQTP